MLINCPECGKEVSDKSASCIHCGYPIQQNLNICNINGNPYNLSIILKQINNKESKGIVIRSICDIFNMALCDAKNLYDIIVETGQIPKTFSCNEIKSIPSNKPRCIYCGSTNLKKISGLSKVGSVAVWGVFAAGRTSKTWHCNNCGAEW